MTSQCSQGWSYSIDSRQNGSFFGLVLFLLGAFLVETLDIALDVAFMFEAFFMLFSTPVPLVLSVVVFLWGSYYR